MCLQSWPLRAFRKETTLLFASCSFSTSRLLLPHLAVFVLLTSTSSRLQARGVSHCKALPPSSHTRYCSTSFPRLSWTGNKVMVSWLPSHLGQNPWEFKPPFCWLGRLGSLGPFRLASSSASLLRWLPCKSREPSRTFLLPSCNVLTSRFSLLCQEILFLLDFLILCLFLFCCTFCRVHSLRQNPRYAGLKGLCLTFSLIFIPQTDQVTGLSPQAVTHILN